jgi:hypothetical protein
MNRYRVQLSVDEAAEGEVLRQAFTATSVVEFRGRRVSVWGQFLQPANGAPARTEYELQPEDGGEAPYYALDETSAQRTVTLDAADAEAVELQRAHRADEPAMFRGELVRVRRQLKHQVGRQWVSTFELEAAGG